MPQPNFSPAVLPKLFVAKNDKDNPLSFRRRFYASKGALIGLVIILLVVVIAICAPLVAPHDPIQTNSKQFLVPPSWQAGGTSEYWLGTDPIGRDMLSRLIFGARLSLLLGMFVVSIAVVLGVSMGLVAGYFKGVLEVVIMRLMDVILTLPSLLLAIVIVGVLGPGLFNAALAVAITELPHFVRITRATVILEMSKDYVTAARMTGASHWRLLLREILPNCAAPLIVQSSLSISTAILDTAALGFLGLGAHPPTPEWGSMLADAQEFISRAWWVVTFPGIAILIMVLAFNLLGDGLRDVLDPKLKR